MTNLRVRSEYSFRIAFGHISAVIQALDSPRVVISDRGGTWAHIEWDKAAKKNGRHAVFGVELAVVSDLTVRDPKQRRATYFTFLARNDSGLREIYELVTEATRPDNFYFNPRIDYKRMYALSKDVIRIVGSNPEWSLLKKTPNLYIGLAPSSLHDTVPMATERSLPVVALSDNYFPRPEDRATYEVVVGRNRDNRTTAMHLLDEHEWRFNFLPGRITDEAIKLTDQLAEECNATLPMARMVKFKATKTLEQMCYEAASHRGIDLKKPLYRDRLKRELALIKEKDFSDYFYVIADVLIWAKSRMLVGPARGSSCGSLVCYLLSITEIDPIPYDLLFERFIDINRKDLPDIDIDFPDISRDLVFDYLKSKYGAENVARLGTVITYKAKNTIDEVARSLNIPKWEVEELKDAMIERSGGDSRASFCILDTFNELEIGKKTLAKYPELAVAANIEGHARSAGQHAAGIVITAVPVNNFCSIDMYMDRAGGIGVTHLDKKDAEALNLLKIDALGLRTLSVIQDTLDQIGWTREKLLKYPTNDLEAFDILNKRRFAGTFQFDGLALQSLTREMTVEQFEDIAALTALARPGPLDSGGAAEWIKRRTGRHEIRYIHPALEPMTRATHGIVMYQETVMRVVREIGGMSWEETSSIRKAMSGRLGKEFFDQFWIKFRDGSSKNGISETDAKSIWEMINTMGSWCVSGETIIQNPFPNHATPASIKIKDLVKNGGYIRPRVKYEQQGFRTGPKSISSEKYDIVKKQQIYCQQQDGNIRPRRLIDCWYSGKKTTFEVKVDSGESIRTTKQHGFEKSDGNWVPLGQLKVGDEVCMMGKPPAGSVHKPFKGTGRGRHNDQHGESVKYKENVEKLKQKYKLCQRCKKAPYEETHHIDGDRMHNDMSNLKPLCRKCHKLIHKESGLISVAHSKGKLARVAKIIFIGNPKEEDTYDIQMPDPENNFVANGFIVHNSFNKSHAVAYALVSYWTLVLKAHFPLEYAAACLRNARSRDSAVLILRDLHREGFQYKLFDPVKSQINWSVQSGILTGGLLNVKGIGMKKAEDIVARRKVKRALPPGITKLLDNPKLDIEGITPTYDVWGKLLEHPERFPHLLKAGNRITPIETISSDTPGEYRILGRIVKKSLRDHNELTKIQKRDGRVMTGQTKYLILTLEDDTGVILTMVNRHAYLDIGAPIIESGAIGDWYMVKGRVNDGMRMIHIEQVRKMLPEMLHYSANQSAK